MDKRDSFYLKVEGDVGQDDPAGIDDQRRDLVSDGLKFFNFERRHYF